jgi:DNA polymerase-3 subunit gamma/tau
MMATTQPEDIPQTIRSRCQHFSFHAVRFEDIVSHLREISAAEGLTVDEDALALLAEAGDGSMRDALSIMDQAISCSGDALTAEVVRGLAGSVSTEVLERVMHAVHENSSDEVLRIVDKLMVEGQSATYFARQTVRFLRNALVAKVAGIESPILQISADEKKRVAGVAALFGEEELTRFLQIMLRTHGDVSYKQEQRFHLELGLLKMVHAQRLLPLEQLLSSVSLSDAASAPGAAAPSTPRQAGTAPRPAPPPSFTPRPPGVAPIAGGSSLFGQTSSKPSPFAADNARKGREDMSAAEDAAPTAHAPASSNTPASDSAQPVPQAFSGRIQAIAAQAMPTAVSTPFDNGSALAVAPRVDTSHAVLDVSAIREAVLQALETGGSQMLSHALEEGRWSVEGSLVAIQVEMSKFAWWAKTPLARRGSQLHPAADAPQPAIASRPGPPMNPW